MDERKRQSYTVMILPNPTSKAYRFSISQKHVKIALSGTAAALVLLLVFLVQYFYMVGNIWELTHLRQETSVQKAKIESFAQTVDGMKTQLDRLKEFDVKLRMITDLNVPADANRYLGVGGEPTTAPVVPTLNLPALGGGAGGTEDPIEPSLDAKVPAESHSAMIREVEEDLATLQVLASKQEQSFQELTEAIEHRRAKWASTPSVWPVKGWVTSGFGPRLSPFSGQPAMHRGVDISVPENTPFVAPANGYVTFTGWDGGLGNAIKIDHGYGYQTAFGHLNKILVQRGQRVKRGDILGLVGSTGLSTGPHLHYQVSVNLVPTNPLRFVLN